jgi:uncharacterized circularly permuted ATP-grasp superfamily protein/uncharacterized alpha-E superfamily protein
MTDPFVKPSTIRFEANRFPPDAYNEAFRGDGRLRDHWLPFAMAFGTIPSDVLNQRQDRVQRMRHEDGATYNPFDAADGRGTPWALDMIPVPIPTDEWADVEAGLLQRATLLERILADVYGPQNLLHQGQLPAELIFANAKFQHSCHGFVPAGGRYLTYYAADLYRSTEGRFRVLRDHAANPAGIGYALENRIVLSRIFSELYHTTQIRRLAPFFHTFHQNLAGRAPKRKEDPGIVLLSPGHDSRIYFEHALLSRYLGYPLVEGQDLTVRNGEVFLKKLAGLEPVEVIYRHIRDKDSDPFTLRQGTRRGVAGLIQACREGKVDVNSPIGSGFVDTPVLSLFLPKLCRQLMDAELLLENHPAWWCGTPSDRNHVMANLDQLVVQWAMQRTALQVSDDLAARINAQPHLYMGRPPIYPAAVPAWSHGTMDPHYALFRVFVCATADGFAVMPGGLAVTSTDVQTLTDGVPEQQQSKDIWVFSEGPVEPFSLMSSLQSVPEFKRGSDLPSRVADHLLWLGRYLERAEGSIRLLRSVYRRLTGEARLVDVPDLPFLLSLLRAENTIPRIGDDEEPVPRYRTLTALLHAALYRKDRPESVVAVLARVRQAARNVRDRLSLDSWRTINHLEGFSDTSTGDPLDLLDDTLFTLSAFSGLAMESMTRGLGWRFMDMGRRVERAINLTHRIGTVLPGICAQSTSALEAILEVADSIMTYRARYRAIFQIAPVLDLLLADESNPKSLAFQCSQLADHVNQLPRKSNRRFTTHEERLALEMLTSVRLIDLTNLDCHNDNGVSGLLPAFLETMGSQLEMFAEQISAHYLVRVPTTPHFSTIYGHHQP